MKSLKIALYLLVLLPLSIVVIESCGTPKTAVVKPAEPAEETADLRAIDPTTAKDSLRIAFYNVENLFDTLDDPIKIDSEYLPNSSLRWTRERYEAKQRNLVKAIEGLGYPSVLGMCEVENRRVLEDLIAQPELRSRNYAIVHYDSPDERGIDVAMLYKSTDFTPNNQASHRVKLPVDKTRDILEVSGLLRGTKITVFVNHWPSRRGGADTSEPKRLMAAQTLKAKTDSLFRLDKKARIVIMGDLNDEPMDKSLTQGLEAVLWNRDSAKTLPHNKLYNLAAAVKRNKKGSYWYRNEWEAIDQIIVSGFWLDGRSKLQMPDSESVLNAEFLTYKDRNGNRPPNRTYTGPIYRGGFSDHFPVYITVYLK
jgi:predicted extracellular nuclease